MADQDTLGFSLQGSFLHDTKERGKELIPEAGASQKGCKNMFCMLFEDRFPTRPKSDNSG